MLCDAMRLTPNLYALFPSLFYIYTTQCYYDLLPWDCSQFNWFSSREKVLIPQPVTHHLKAVAVLHPLPNKIILLTNCCSVYNIFCCRNNNIYSLFLFLFCADVLVPFPWCLCVPSSTYFSWTVSPLLLIRHHRTDHRPAAAAVVVVAVAVAVPLAAVLTVATLRLLLLLLVTCT